MLICHCCAQSEKSIKQCINEGARTEGDVGARCGAGTECGGCLPLLRALIEESESQQLHSVA